MVISETAVISAKVDQQERAGGIFSLQQLFSQYVNNQKCCNSNKNIDSVIHLYGLEL